MNDPARDSSALRVANNRMTDAYNGLTRLLTSRDEMCERCGLHRTCGMPVSSTGSWPHAHLCRPCCDAETQADAFAPQQPFTGQDNRLDE